MMDTDTSTYLKDQFLIAMPMLEDPNFAQSLTYICEHSEKGAMGIVVNKPLDLTLDDVLLHIGLNHPQTPYMNQPIFAGGPVHTDRGFILHTGDSNWESTLPITDTINLTTSKDILEAIAHGEGPNQFLIALGYAGWSAGQLEEEITSNSWLCNTAKHQLIFDLPIDQRWQLAARQMGVDLNLLSLQVGHA